MKVSRDYIGNLMQHRKTQSLSEKTLIGRKRAVFNIFQSSMGGGFDNNNNQFIFMHLKAHDVKQSQTITSTLNKSRHKDLQMSDLGQLQNSCNRLRLQLLLYI